MLWIIISVIFDLSHAYVIHMYSNVSIDTCAGFQEPCNPYLNTPCCDISSNCQALVWATPDVYACIRKVKSGTPCQCHLDCSGTPALSCDFSKKLCKCGTNYGITEDLECIPLLNGYCEKNSDCIVINSVCNNYKCRCKPTYVPSGNFICELSPLEERCTHNSNCKAADNAICSEGICKCRAPYRVVNRAQCGSYLDGYCERNSDCWAGNSECVHNQCRCEFAYVATSYYNCQLSPLGKPCDNGDQVCNSMFYDLQMMTKKYVCQLGKCTSLLGEFCIHKEDCASSRWQCIRNTCTRHDGFAPRHKWVLGRLHESCETDINCDKDDNLICSDYETCDCEEDYFQYKNQTCARKLGQPCSEARHCVLKYSHCFLGRCQCIPNYIEISDTLCEPLHY